MAEAKKPNILVIMADDVGVWNISAYHRGMMGGRPPSQKSGSFGVDQVLDQLQSGGK